MAPQRLGEGEGAQRDPADNTQGRATAAATWALVHSMADLLLTDHFPYLLKNDTVSETLMLRNILVRRLFASALGQTRAAALAPPPPGN